MGIALFDLDNTLLDREAAFSRWAEAFIRNNGLPESARRFLEATDQDGMTPKDIFFEEIRDAFNISSDVDTLLVRYHIEYPACYTVDAEVVRGLRQLRAQGWRTAVVSNGSPAQMAKLEATDLTGEFDAICISELVGVAKPDPAIFEMAAELCETPLQGWMTGDSPTADILGARGVGLRTIWIARGRIWDLPDDAPEAAVNGVNQAIKIILESDSR